MASNGRTVNRAREIASHIPKYGFRTQARLAADTGVSPANISRMVRNVSGQRLATALRVSDALSRRLGKRVDVREVFSLDGTYPTQSACELAGCRGCQLDPGFAIRTPGRK